MPHKTPLFGIAKPLWRAVLVALTLPFPFFVSAQSTEDAAADEAVVLSPFEVSAAQTGRYQAVEATSGSRMRVSLFDTTQSVSVVTRDLIEDIGAGRILDAAKYVSGVYESTIPNAQDRTTIRGFQNDGATVDGFGYFSFGQVDPVLIERIEVVKGPNAIIAPQGVPGGTLNMVSKKPMFSNQGMLSAQVGRYSSSRAELDVNRVLIPKKLAVRVVGAGQDADDYGRGNFHQSVTVMPMLTYRFGARSELTLQVEAYNTRLMNHLGVPISLYATSTGNWRILDGLPRDFVPTGKNIVRHQSAQHYRAFFTTSFSDNFSMRLALNGIRSRATSGQLNVGAALNQVVTVDPNTGLTVWDGVTRNDDPLFPLGGGRGRQARKYANLQNDFAYEFKSEWWKSTTVFGWAANFSGSYQDGGQDFAVPSPARFDASYEPPVYSFTEPFERWGNYRGRSYQAYIYEVLSFSEERLILSGSVSWNDYYNDPHNVYLGLRGHNNPHATLFSGGVVYKVIPNLSVYYGYSEQRTGIGPDLSNPNPFDTQSSEQHEVGLRVRLLDGRFYASVAYFDIQQENYSVPNPGNLAIPPPFPALPPLYSDRTADGVEFELTYNATKHFSLIGNMSVMKNRDPDNLPFRGNAEKSAALWVNYRFDSATPLDGLSVGIGADYLDKRAGDAPGGVTSASTPDNVIRVASSFWLPERTLVNLNLSYQFNAAWRAQLNVDNLLDKDYLMASLNRSFVWVGTPRNAKFTLIYRF